MPVCRREPSSVLPLESTNPRNRFHKRTIPSNISFPPEARMGRVFGRPKGGAPPQVSLFNISPSHIAQCINLSNLQNIAQSAPKTRTKWGQPNFLATASTIDSGRWDASGLDADRAKLREHPVF